MESMVRSGGEPFVPSGRSRRTGFRRPAAPHQAWSPGCQLTGSPAGIGRVLIWGVSGDAYGAIVGRRTNTPWEMEAESAPWPWKRRACTKA